ncbi:MAG: alanine racemase, partial [Acidobacteria bacterium]|nr:alanine racemase [Acidobacteriota bacterium]
DTRAFAANVETIASTLPDGSRLIAVLKADAYGHGAVELARVCKPERVAMIATALLEESLALRNAGISLPLLVLGPMDDAGIAAALDAQITPGVPGPEELAAACRVAKDRDVAIHLKLDSGMGRMGVTEGELAQVIEQIRSAPRLRIEGIYTHLANADDPGDPFTETQIANYDRMLAELQAAGVDAPRHHFANSAATLRHLVRPGDFARVGIALYGPGPSAPTESMLRWRTEILRLKQLPAGAPVGYGTTWRASRPSRIATLPVGYADGFSRRNSSNGDVLVRGRRAPIVGRVSMDLVTIDVTDIPDAAYGDEVVLLGTQGEGHISADELAARTGTISFDVFTGIGARVPRVHHDS